MSWISQSQAECVCVWFLCNFYLFSFVFFRAKPMEHCLCLLRVVGFIFLYFFFVVHTHTHTYRDDLPASAAQPAPAPASASASASVWAFARVRMWAEFLNRTRKLDIENYVYALPSSALCCAVCAVCRWLYFASIVFPFHFHTQLHSRFFGFCRKSVGVALGCRGLRRVSYRVFFFGPGRKVTVLSSWNYNARRRLGINRNIFKRGLEVGELEKLLLGKQNHQDKLEFLR